MLGDHDAWQKECYFDGSCRIPFLVSWPAKLPRYQRRPELVCLTDLFAIATGAAGEAEVREGVDVLGVIAGKQTPRESYAGYYGSPGTRDFKIMVRMGDWKYIYLANGGREQLFNLEQDPHEVRNRAGDAPEKARLRELAVAAVDRTNADRALEAGKLVEFAFEARPLKRIYQMDGSRGVKGFPEQPEEVVCQTNRGRQRS
jgi:choline-sulfatase